MGSPRVGDRGAAEKINCRFSDTKAMSTSRGTVAEVLTRELKTIVHQWAKKHRLVRSYHKWRTYEETFGEQQVLGPGTDPILAVLSTDEGFFQALTVPCDALDDFEKTLLRSNFWWEDEGLGHFVFYPRKPALAESLYEHIHFDGLLRRISTDFGEIELELIAHFARYPNDFGQLEPRQFEMLLEAIFRNQGYDTEIGAGWNDGGVDLRFYSKDEVGSFLTLVQVKRWKRPVRLEAVAALVGLVEQEDANRGLFVTTPHYLPSTRRFASRSSRRLVLAKSEDVARWCESAVARRGKADLLEKGYKSYNVAEP
jgi:restriction endonuclease